LSRWCNARQEIAMPSPFICLPSRSRNPRVPPVRPWRLVPRPGEPPYPRMQGSGPYVPEEQTINICRPFGLPNLGGPSDLGRCRSRGVQVGGSSTQGTLGSIPVSRSESRLTTLLYRHSTWPPRGRVSFVPVPARRASLDLEPFTLHFRLALACYM
jgi:hypothetical protein